MRFTNLLTLLAASSALAYNVKRDAFDDEAQKLGQLADSASPEQLDNTTNDVFNLAKATNATYFSEPINDVPLDDSVLGPSNGDEQCLKSSYAALACLRSVNNKPKNEVCKIYESNEDCQSVAKEDLNLCIDIIKMNVIIFDQVRAICLKDENGNFCPVAKSLQEEKVYDKVTINETCKSKKCTEETYNVLKHSQESLLIFASKPNYSVTLGNRTEEFLSMLKDEKCVGSSSAASTTPIKFGSALLATLAVAFYLF